MIAVPASCLAFGVLLLVVSGRRAAVRISAHFAVDNPAQGAFLRGIIRLGVLILPVIMAALVAYVGAEMAARSL
jgi:hypothetical protein